MLYAYHEGKENSSRIVEKNCIRDVNYMYLLEGRKAPDHAAIARFRTKHFAKCANQLLAQMTDLLYRLNQVTDTEVFIDGTKIEASANKYTFVWKKADKAPGAVPSENCAACRRYYRKIRIQAPLAQRGA